MTSSSACICILNGCDDIDLIGRRCSVFKGTEESDKFNTITLGSRDKVIIKSSKTLFGCVEGCLIYEIVKHNDHRTPLIQGSRIFLAIGVSISPHQVNKRKVAVKLISVYSRGTTGTKEGVKTLYKDFLRYFMRTHSQDSQWDLGGLVLNFEVHFDRKARVELYVCLSRASALSGGVPIFYNLSSL
jgi:hypothetical protein